MIGKMNTVLVKRGLALLGGRCSTVLLLVPLDKVLDQRRVRVCAPHHKNQKDDMKEMADVHAPASS
jgi:hypothetical protein